MSGNLKAWLLPKARRRRIVCALLAVWLAALSLGMPLPFSPSKQASASRQPFPCQFHRCGCRDADHCWQQCCCMTREQRLAWAVEHGVTPPDSFFSPQEAASHHEQLAGKAKPCCAKNHGEPAAAAERHSQPQSRAEQVALLDVLKCHGEAMSWTATIPPSLRPDALIRELLADGPSSALPGEQAILLSDLAFEPPVPPPRG